MAKRNNSCLGNPNMIDNADAESSKLSKYQKLTDREHILKKPDTYIGSIENTEYTNYVFVSDKIKETDQTNAHAKSSETSSDMSVDVDSDVEDIGTEDKIPTIDTTSTIAPQNSDNDGGKIVLKNIQYIPGLYKLFDEGIVNCRDHVIRQQQAIADKVDGALPVTNIDVTIDSDGTIHMFNDGNGIDVAEHPEYKLWIPEMIFGHLRTSTNYDEKKKE